MVYDILHIESFIVNKCIFLRAPQFTHNSLTFQNSVMQRKVSSGKITQTGVARCCPRPHVLVLSVRFVVAFLVNLSLCLFLFVAFHLELFYFLLQQSDLQSYCSRASTACVSECRLYKCVSVYVYVCHAFARECLVCFCFSLFLFLFRFFFLIVFCDFFL